MSDQTWTVGKVEFVDRMPPLALDDMDHAQREVAERLIAGPRRRTVRPRRTSPEGPGGIDTSELRQRQTGVSIRHQCRSDPRRDFAPITLIATIPNLLLVAPSFPAKSVEELINIARSNPGAVHYGSAGVGISNHLGMELFKQMAQSILFMFLIRGARPH